MVIYRYLADICKRYADEPAIICDAKLISFGELFEDIAALKSIFEAQSLPPGRSLSLLLSNGPDFLPILLALSACGAVVMPLSTSLSSSQISDTISRLKSQGVLTRAGSNLGLNFKHHRKFSFKGESYSLDFSPSEEPFCPHIKNPAFVRPTSGTTGEPKGVVLSHASVIERLETSSKALPIEARDRVCWVMPMAYHFIASLLLYLRQGAALVIARDDSADAICETIKQHSCNILYASPSHYSALSKFESGSRLPSLRLAISTTGLLGKKTAHDFYAKYSLAVTQIYGMIEAGLALGNYKWRESEPELCGEAMPGIEAAVLDSQGNSLVGAAGFLALRGPGFCDGYVEDSALPLEQGWFLTGDMALKRADGAIRVLGRKSSSISMDGKELFPEAIEQLANSHPEVIGSYCYLNQFGQLQLDYLAAQLIEPQEIRDFLLPLLADSVAPKHFQQVESLPLNAAGKITRTFELKL